MIKKFVIKKISKIFNKTDSFIFSLSLINLPKSNLIEDKFIKELRNEVSKTANTILKTDSKIDITWATRLREFIMRDDPRKFLSWDTIRETMFPGHALYIYKELKYNPKH